MNIYEIDEKKYLDIEKFYSLLHECMERVDYKGVYASIDDELKAKSLLIEFFENLEKLEPTKMIYAKMYYYSFTSYMFKFYSALIKEQYCGACGELLEMCFFEPILQQRIYYNLLDIYHRLLKPKN